MSGAGYFGFTPGGTQYSNAAYGAAPTAGYAVTYAATYPHGFTAATATAPYGGPQYAATQAHSQPHTPQHQQQTMQPTGYTQRIDNTSFVSGSTPNQMGGQAQKPAGVQNKSNNAGKVSTYTGYDAAVYAAATSYLQSKAQGAGSQWLGLKRGGAGGTETQMNSGGSSGRGGGRGGFPRKGPGGRGGHSGGGGGVQQLHYCDVCKISCAGPQTYREHLEGQKHKKKEAQAKSGTTQPLARSKASFRCDLCGVTCTGQDTYNAHVRGSKHQKTLKLHQTLGKPIPSGDPVIIPPAGMGGKAAAATGGADVNATPLGKKVVGVPKMNFVGGSKLASTGLGPQEITAETAANSANQEAIEAALALEKDVQPVGEDYVEPIKDHTGKVVQFFCKLCDCKFNDLNAKDMHLKGRRHRLQFKKKVNPELEVDMKLQPGRNRRQSEEKLRKELMRLRQQELWSMRAMYQHQMMPPPLMGTPKPLFGNAPAAPRTGETLDDRHVMSKHGRIYPTDEELTAVQRIVANTEKALKGVSDFFSEEEKKKKEETDVKTEETKGGEAERMLKGVMRVGLLAKGLLLRGDLNVTLVVLCSEKPTLRLLQKVLDLVPKHLETTNEEKYEVVMGFDQASIMISSVLEPKAQVQVILTSVLMREAEGEASTKPDEVDVLEKQKCLEALADLRHAKWFQARCSNLQSCLVVLRLMRDICQRIPTWQPLTDWTLELLVEKVLTSAGVPLSPGEALRRVFEAVASGILLPIGPGLLDPCEKEVVDATASLTPQQREDITSSAQHALRLIAFNQLYKILGIERLPDKHSIARKRPRDSTEGAEPMDTNGKKDKKDSGEEAAAAATTATTTAVAEKKE